MTMHIFIVYMHISLPNQIGKKLILDLVPTYVERKNSQMRINFLINYFLQNHFVPRNRIL